MRHLLVIGLAVITCAGAAGATRTAVAPPLIGANYSHHTTLSCSLDDTAIIGHYQERGARRRVQGQLGAMRAAGVETLRLLLWHMTDANGHRWGVVSSSGGRLSEPVRSNLIRYLRDVRAAGFERLTLSFAPMWTNWPSQEPYDPATFEENWKLVEHVRPMLKRFGPPDTRIDLSNEVVPRDNWDSPTVIAQAKEYVGRLWTRYVDAFGRDDASFSVIGGNGPEDAVPRLRNLLAVLHSTGRPLPLWVDVHPPYDHDGALATLHAVDEVLTADGSPQTIVVGEEAYDDAPVAAAIDEFIRTSSRHVDEVMEWPLTADRPCSAMSVSAPYRADAYITALTGQSAPPPTPDPLPLPPVPTLYASIGGAHTISLMTKAGKPVGVLDSGPYRFVVRDRSTQDNFHLTGPDIDRRTGLRFRGTVTWRVDIGRSTPYGSRYVYSSDRRGARLRKSFRIS
jgi:hypothetical protein